MVARRISFTPARCFNKAARSFNRGTVAFYLPIMDVLRKGA
jgi:hypothetical protein